jgi:hypothetical protein
MRGGLVACTSAAALLSVSEAGGADFTWCIDGGSPADSPSGCSDPCSNPADFATFTQAIAAAELAAEAAGPTNLEHVLCLRGARPLEDSLSLDVATTSLRGTLTLVTADSFATTLCRPPALDPMTPLIDLIGGSGSELQLQMQTGVFLPAECTVDASPVLRSRGVPVSATKVRIVGGIGPAIDVSDADLVLGDFRIQGVAGAAVVGGGAWTLRHGELSSNRSPDAALIEHAGGDLVISQTALHANLVERAPLIRSGGTASVQASYLGQNVVLGNFPLTQFAGSERSPFSPSGIWFSSIEGNRLQDSGIVTTPPIEDPGLFPEAPPICLPLGADGLNYRHRPAPEATTEGVGLAGLFEVRGVSGAPQGAFALSQCLIQGNLFGGPLLTVVETTALQLTVIGNTIELEAPVPILRTEDPKLGWVSSRNLLLSPFEPLTETDSLGKIEATMDFTGSEVPHPLDGANAVHTILGPTIQIDDPDSLLLGEVAGAALSECARLNRLCPNLAENCDTLLAGDDELPCALGNTAALIPRDDSIATLSAPWPWATQWDEQVGYMNVAGATGEDCDAGLQPFDTATNSFGNTGDGDGFTELTDCDNENVAIAPELPAAHDVIHGPCTSRLEACFSCPPELESGTDDDDSTMEPDDDDSGRETAPQPDPPAFEEPEEEDCIQVRGCGISWAGVSMIFGIGGVSRRRRRGYGT